MIDSNDDDEIIYQCALRAKNINSKIKVLTVIFDLTSVNLHTPLQLKELLNSDEFNFTHDVFGIINHINRETGKLENSFQPRFAVHQ